MAVVEGGKRALTTTACRRSARSRRVWTWRSRPGGPTRSACISPRFGLGIIGDPVYRPRRRPQIGAALQRHLANFERIALHAYRLGFTHPVTGAWRSFERPPPPSFDRLGEHLRAEVACS